MPVFSNQGITHLKEKKTGHKHINQYLDFPFQAFQPAIE